MTELVTSGSVGGMVQQWLSLPGHFHGGQRRPWRHGTLDRYIGEFSVTVLTSTPTIFDQAIGNADFYAAIRRKALSGSSGKTLLFELALEDLAQTADLFRPIHAESGGVDG